MTKKKVLVTHKLPEEGFTDLCEMFNVTFPDQPSFSFEEVIARIEDYDAILSMFNFSVNKELIDAGKNLKIISNFGVGYNNIDVDYAKNKGIMVTNTPDPVIEPTAEMAFALMLACARRVSECDRKLRNPGTLKWGVMENLGVGLAGKTLGIVGLGRIGKSVAKKAEAFGMKIVYHNRKECDYKNALFCKTLDDLLAVADFVSLNVPLTDETHHLIGEKEFNKMKRNAILINTSRGPVIDEKALSIALKNHTIMAAGLDVFEKEPIIEQELLDLDNVVIAPHNGTATIDARIEMGKHASNNIINYFYGGEFSSVW